MSKERATSPPINIQIKKLSSSDEDRQKAKIKKYAKKAMMKQFYELPTKLTTSQKNVAMGLNNNPRLRIAWREAYNDEIKLSGDTNRAAEIATKKLMQMVVENEDDNTKKVDSSDDEGPFKMDSLEGGSKTRKKSRKFRNNLRKNKISRKYIMLKQCGGKKAKKGAKSNPFSSKAKASRSSRKGARYYKKKGRTLKMAKKSKSRKRTRRRRRRRR
jgi:hypothetical protein